jgi:hypothetical protein
MRVGTVPLSRPGRIVAGAVWCLALTTLGLVAWGVLRAAPAPTHPWAPLTLSGGAALVLGLRPRHPVGVAVRLLAALLGLVSALLWTMP